MFIVLFEETVPPECQPLSNVQHAGLTRIAENQYGFISCNRYRATDDRSKILTMAKYLNEDTALRWHNDPHHLQALTKARKGSLNYRVRAGEVVPPAEYFTTEAKQGTQKKERYAIVFEKPIEHERTIDQVIALGSSACLDHLVDKTQYHNSTSVVWLSSWRMKQHALKSVVSEIPLSILATQQGTLHLVHVFRDYGSYDRDEAPTEVEEQQQQCQKESTDHAEMAAGHVWNECSPFAPKARRLKSST